MYPVSAALRSPTFAPLARSRTPGVRPGKGSPFLPEEQLDRTLALLPARERLFADRCPLPEGPPAERPLTQILGGRWEFEATPPGSAPIHREVQLPHQWALEGGPLGRSGSPVTYRKKFQVSPEMVAPGRHVRLRFQSVDYQAEVFLNGRRLGDHEGYFSPFSWEVGQLLRTDRENVLEVKVGAPADPGAPFFKSQVKGVFGQHDSRPGAFLPAGLDPLDEMGHTGGILEEVQLRSTGPQAVERLAVETRLLEDGKSARVTFRVGVRQARGESGKVRVEVDYWSPQDPEHRRTVAREAELRPGVQEVPLEILEEEPRLWWTADRGEPHLYEAEVRVVHDGSLSDQRRDRFGIRDVRFDPSQGSLLLNGQEVFLRGINYLPTRWLSLWGPERYARDLDAMQDLHLNAVRVHAHVLPDEFYSQADEQGMLVWADFPLIWGQSVAPEFQKEVSHQLRAFVGEHQRHPSIFTWCVHNESFSHDVHLDRSLAAEARRLDPTRTAIPNSGFKSHLYPGWYPGFPDRFTAVGGLERGAITEYGPQAAPAELDRLLAPDHLWPRDEEAWHFHNFQRHESDYHLGPPALYASAADFARASQAYQADSLRYLTEHFRRHKGQPTQALFPYQLRDPWPAFGWGVLDHAGQPKASYPALKEAMAPVLLSAEWTRARWRAGEEVRVPLWAVNDTLEAVPGARVRWAVVPEGRQAAAVAGDSRLDLEPDSSAPVGEAAFRLPADASPGQAWVLVADLADPAGRTLARTHYRFECGSQRRGAEPYRSLWLDEATVAPLFQALEGHPGSPVPEPTPPPAGPTPPPAGPVAKALGPLSRLLQLQVISNAPVMDRGRLDRLEAVLQPGDILVMVDTNLPLLGVAAHAAVGSHHTHSLLYEGDGQILEANVSGLGAGGCARRPLADMLGHRIQVEVIRPPYATPEDREAALDYCRSRIGTPYDFLFDLEDDGALYCTEYLARALESTPHPLAVPRTRTLGREAIGLEAFRQIPGSRVVYSDGGRFLDHLATGSAMVLPAIYGGLGLAAAGGSLALLPLGAGVGLALGLAAGHAALARRAPGQAGHEPGRSTAVPSQAGPGR